MISAATMEAAELPRHLRQAAEADPLPPFVVLGSWRSSEGHAHPYGDRYWTRAVDGHAVYFPTDDGLTYYEEMLDGALYLQRLKQPLAPLEALREAHSALIRAAEALDIAGGTLPARHAAELRGAAAMIADDWLPNLEPEAAIHG